MYSNETWWDDDMIFGYESLNIESDVTSALVRRIPGFDDYCISEYSELFRIGRFSNRLRIKHFGHNFILADNYGYRHRLNREVLMDMVGFNNRKEIRLLPGEHGKAYRVFADEKYYITEDGVLLKQFHEVSDGNYRITVDGVRRYITSEELIDESRRLMSRRDRRPVRRRRMYTC